MANIHPEIKPNGVMDKYIIDLMYMLQQSMYGLCLKLDNDGGVPLTTYVANCYTAPFHVRVFDYRGNMTTNVTTLDHIVTPVGGLSDAALIEWIYDWINAFETLTEQLDTDVLTDSTYESLGYYACILPYMFESGRYGQTTILGNDNTSGGFSATPDAYAPWFATKIGPIGRPNDKVLCDLFYDMLNAWETMTEQLDGDGTVTDTNYEALWYTATVLMKVENCQGNVLGNAQTRLG
jgi:hypothetical protein